MKLRIGVTKKSYEGKVKDEDLICTVEFDNSVTIEELKNKIIENINLKTDEKIGKVSDNDIIYVLTDLGDMLGGCAIGGATYNATKVSISRMVAGQLARQVINTLCDRIPKRCKGLQLV